jgi:benzoyl-CoA reductase subunit C
VFPEWEGKPLEEILRLCRDLVEDPAFPTVRRWRAAGGKVVGHFQVYFPEEIAHAAGALPFKLRGAPIEPTHADSLFGSYLCSIVKTTLETVISGHAQVDLFVVPPICDAARNQAGIWGRHFSFPCEILYLPQNAPSRKTISSAHSPSSIGTVRSCAGSTRSSAKPRGGSRPRTPTRSWRSER